MQDVGGLYAIVGLVTNLAPIAIMIGLVLFLLALIFKLINSAGGKNKISDKLNLGKRMIVAMLAMTFLLFMSVGSAQGAVGLSLDSQTNFGGTVATLKATGLTVNTEYTVFPLANAATLPNFTFTASDATEWIPVPIPDETDGSFTWNIANSASGIAQSANASVFITISDPADFLPTDFFLNIMVPLIIIVIIVGIVVSLIKSF